MATLPDEVWVGLVKNGTINLTHSRKAKFEPLSDDEKQYLSPTLCCPDCLLGVLSKGPQGGLSVNVYCNNSRCGSKFNLAPYPDQNKSIHFLIAERL